MQKVKHYNLRIKQKTRKQNAIKTWKYEQKFKYR